jgi:CDP-alcohol phosphatidyltransferase
MLDAQIQPLISPPLDWAGRLLARAGVHANAVTLSGAAVALAAIGAIADAEYSVALILIALCRTLDGLDGAVARARGRTDLGGYLDMQVCQSASQSRTPLPTRCQPRRYSLAFCSRVQVSSRLRRLRPSAGRRGSPPGRRPSFTQKA